MTLGFSNTYVSIRHCTSAHVILWKIQQYAPTSDELEQQHWQQQSVAFPLAFTASTGRFSGFFRALAAAGILL